MNACAAEHNDALSGTVKTLLQHKGLKGTESEGTRRANGRELARGLERIQHCSKVRELWLKHGFSQKEMDSTHCAQCA